MNKNIKYFVVIILITLFSDYSLSQTKLAQTGMKLLGISLGARASGMADAMTAIEETNSDAMFYNPAGMARQEGFASASIGSVKWIADINYYHASLALKPFDGNYGVVGLNFLYANYGEFIGTVSAKNPKGYIETGIFKPNAYAIGLGYAKELSDKFAVGGNVKWVFQNLGSAWTDYTMKIVSIDTAKNDTVRVPEEIKSDYNKGILAFDFGVQYKTGFKSLVFGMAVRNFSTEVKYVQEGFQLPLAFKIGLAMDLFDLTSMDKNMYNLNFAVDAIHHRDYPEQFNIGAEFIFMKMVALRLGYSTPNDERNFTFGLGVGKQIAGATGVHFDYSYVPFGRFDPVHRLSLSFSF